MQNISHLYPKSLQCFEFCQKKLLSFFSKNFKNFTSKLEILVIWIKDNYQKCFAMLLKISWIWIFFGTDWKRFSSWIRHWKWDFQLCHIKQLCCVHKITDFDFLYIEITYFWLGMLKIIFGLTMITTAIYRSLFWAAIKLL